MSIRRTISLAGHRTIAAVDPNAGLVKTGSNTPNLDDRERIALLKSAFGEAQAALDAANAEISALMAQLVESNTRVVGKSFLITSCFPSNT